MKTKVQVAHEWKHVDNYTPEENQECLIKTEDGRVYQGVYIKGFIRKCFDDAPKGFNWYTTIPDAEYWTPN